MVLVARLFVSDMLLGYLVTWWSRDPTNPRTIHKRRNPAVGMVCSFCESVLSNFVKGGFWPYKSEFGHSVHLFTFSLSKLCAKFAAKLIQNAKRLRALDPLLYNNKQNFINVLTLLDKEGPIHTTFQYHT